jgi:hypothetical protein
MSSYAIAFACAVVGVVIANLISKWLWKDK